MHVNMESVREKEVILRARHSVQSFIYLTYTGLLFLCRALMPISVTIPIYPSWLLCLCQFQCLCLNPTLPEKCCLPKVRLPVFYLGYCSERPAYLLTLLFQGSLHTTARYSTNGMEHFLLSLSHWHSVTFRMKFTFLAHFSSFISSSSSMNRMLRSTQNLLIVWSYYILSHFFGLCIWYSFSMEHSFPLTHLSTMSFKIHLIVASGDTSLAHLSWIRWYSTSRASCGISWALRTLGVNTPLTQWARSNRNQLDYCISIGKLSETHRIQPGMKNKQESSETQKFGCRNHRKKIML